MEAHVNRFGNERFHSFKTQEGPTCYMLNEKHLFEEKTFIELLVRAKYCDRYVNNIKPLHP